MIVKLIFISRYVDDFIFSSSKSLDRSVVELECCDASFGNNALPAFASRDPRS